MSTGGAEEADVPERSCVVVDCNEWIRLKWFGSPIGLTFLSALKGNIGLRMAIPEVLADELNKHRADAARNLLRRLEEIHSEIGTVTGDGLAAGIITLTEVAINVAILQRLAVVADQTIHPEMTITQVRGALKRVNDEAPPNSPKNQQMKDSLLWEACLALSEEYKVFFVSRDNGFYAGRQPDNGLAENLTSELSVKSGQLQVFPSLEEALKMFAPGSLADPHVTHGIDVKKLLAAESVRAFARSSFADEVRVGELRGVVPEYFRTASPHVFSASFTTFFYVGGDTEGRLQGQAAVSGECTLDARAGAVIEVTLESIDWMLQDVYGKEHRTRELLTSMA